MQQQSGIKFDVNGEEIIVEGICHRNGVYLRFFMSALATSAISLLGMMIAIPLSIFVARVLSCILRRRYSLPPGLPQLLWC